MAATRLHARGCAPGPLTVVPLADIFVLTFGSTMASATPTPAVSLVSVANMAYGAPAHEQDHAEERSGKQQ